jgi:hypothetical protein
MVFLIFILYIVIAGMFFTGLAVYTRKYPVNCMWSEWKSWSSCKNNYQERSRIIQIEPDYNGLQCLGTKYQYSICPDGELDKTPSKKCSCNGYIAINPKTKEEKCICYNTYNGVKCEYNGDIKSINKRSGCI